MLQSAKAGSYNRYHNEEGIVHNHLSSTKFGKFQLFWDSFDPYFFVIHIDEPHKILFQTLPSQSFITVGYATDSNPPIVDGNFKANEWVLFETGYQSIDKVEIENDCFVIHGEVWGLVTRASFVMRFSIGKEEILPSSSSSSSSSFKELSSQLAFEVNVTPIQGTFNRVFLNYWSDSKENFYGFGSQFTHWNLNGRRIPILCAENGIGRGAQPITSLLNLLGDRAGGDWSTTYAPKPLYITNFNRSIVFENTEMMFFDLRDDDAVIVEVWGSSLKGRIIYGRSMLDLITEITAITGRMKPLPDWTQQGAVAGLEGGTAEVTHLVEKLLSHNVPLAAVWIQDWVGLRKAFDGDRLKWNWQLDNSYYPKWSEMTKYWAEKHGIRTMSYINPFFSENGEVVEGSRNLYREGIDRGYFVQSPQGGSYKMHSGSIEFCMLDTTNPTARRWMIDIMKKDMIQESGSSGWMADFGEYLPFDSVLYGGQMASEYHNRYPEEWAKINAIAIQESSIAKTSSLKINRKLTNGIYTKEGGMGQDYVEDREVIHFQRSAGLKSPTYTSLFWLGDQLVSWDEHDGLKSAIVGALSGGIGGHSITHTDIGGYTMQDKGPMLYVRSKELLLRWIEFSAFGSALFRSHVGSNTSPLNSQIYQDEETLTHFAHFSRIFAHLAEYRGVLMTDAEVKGWPLMRQMAAHYAHDENTWELTDQYMFGSELLIAPVLNPVGSESKARVSVNARNGGGGKDQPVASVKVYLPARSVWVHLWTGQTVHAGDNGRFVSVDAPMGYPPVFYPPYSIYGLKLREFVIANNYHATYSDEEVFKNNGYTSTDGSFQSQNTVISPTATSNSESLLTKKNNQNSVQTHVKEGLSKHMKEEAVSLIYTCEAIIGEISDYIAPDWAEWLGISQYVSKWDSSYYSTPLTEFIGAV